MGNSKSNTPKTKNENIPIKPTIKKTRVAGPVNGYDYYPAPYTSEQYAYPIYPVVSSEKHLQNEFFPQLRAENVHSKPSAICFVETKIY
jgi:hypothetical protein